MQRKEKLLTQQLLKDAPVGLLRETVGELMLASSWHTGLRPRDQLLGCTDMPVVLPLFHDQEGKMSCKLQPFCVKRTHQALTNRNVSYSILLQIQQRLIGSWLLFPALGHLMSLAVGRWLM